MSLSQPQITANLTQALHLEALPKVPLLVIIHTRHQSRSLLARDPYQVCAMHVREWSGLFCILYSVPETE